MRDPGGHTRRERHHEGVESARAVSQKGQRGRETDPEQPPGSENAGEAGGLEVSGKKNLRKGRPDTNEKGADKET